MQFTSALKKPSYTTILTVTGTDENGLPDKEAKAQRNLLNHILLERMGIDMGGILGLNASRKELAEIFIADDKEAKTPEEKAKRAVKKVNELILTFQKALDNLRFPNTAASQSR